MSSMFDSSLILSTLSSHVNILSPLPLECCPHQKWQNSLIGCIDKGEESLKQFVQERLIPQDEGAAGEPTKRLLPQDEGADEPTKRLLPQDEGAAGEPTKSCYAPMKRSGVKTMTELTKPFCIKTKTVKIDAEEMYFFKNNDS